MAYQAFPLTHWSLVKRAGVTDPAARKEALQMLLARYIPALRSYLVVVLQRPGDEADEIVQGFITEQLLSKSLIANADQSKGRFRTYLLTSLRNYAVDTFRRQRRRRAEMLDQDGVADIGHDAETMVLAHWAQSLLGTVITAMKQECVTNQRMDIWQVFEERILLPIFGDTVPPSYVDLAKRLKLASPTQAANLLITGKRMYMRLLRAAVGEYERNPEDIDNEISDLHRLLAR